MAHFFLYVPLPRYKKTYTTRKPDTFILPKCHTNYGFAITAEIVKSVDLWALGNSPFLQFLVTTVNSHSYGLVLSYQCILYMFNFANTV